MNPKIIIRLFYIVYSLYILLVTNITSITFLAILPALVMLWINYGAFSMGYNTIKDRGDQEKVQGSWLIRQDRLSLCFISALSILFSLIAVKYYTGQTPMSVYNNLVQHKSLYNLYQAFFAINQRYILSIQKLPYVFMLFFIKWVLFYSYTSFLVAKERLCRFDAFYLLMITAPHIYTAIARGTNYEYFEILMLIIYAVFTKARKKNINIKSFAIIGILGCMMILVFSLGIRARGYYFNNYISDDVLFDSNSFLSKSLPLIAYIVGIMYGYFGHGFYYVANYINNIWFYSVSNFITGMLPSGFVITKGTQINSMVAQIIDVGVKWHPDTVNLINQLGYFFFIILFLILGMISKKISMSYKNSVAYLTNFMIVLQMISLPVGNFVTASSASKLIVITLAFYWMWVIYYNKIRDLLYGKIKK
jgi:hypothetical protein